MSNFESPLRHHGGLSHTELHDLGLRAEGVIDFSVSVNPFGPNAQLLSAVQNAPIGEYPDPDCTLSRARLAQRLQTDPDRIALGNGACELLWTLARCLAGPHTKALLAEPTFCEYGAAVHATGGQTVAVWTGEEDGFDTDFLSIGKAAKQNNVDSLYLCAPTSPAGRHVPIQEIRNLALDLPSTSLVVDQAFLPLSDHAEEATESLPSNCILVRSLTKELGIPGIRIGYLIAEPPLVAALERNRPRWSVSAPAQAIAAEACRLEPFVKDSRRRLRELRGVLSKTLAKHGMIPVPSSANYCLAKLPPNNFASTLRERLLRHHRILVRDCTSFGLPSYVRLGVRPLSEIDRLDQALEQALQQ